MDDLKVLFSTAATAGQDWLNNNSTNTTQVGSFLDFIADSRTIASDFRDQYNDTDATFNMSSIKDNHAVRYMFLYHLLGYMWSVEFIKAIGMMTIAGAIASDYWITKEAMKPSMPTAGAFYRTLRYHLGSAAFGSFIIAVIRVIRAIMM